MCMSEIKERHMNSLQQCQMLQVVVHVKNELFTDEVTVHWHGISQLYTPWMDGTGQVTQVHRLSDVHALLYGEGSPKSYISPWKCPQANNTISWSCSPKKKDLIDQNLSAFWPIPALDFSALYNPGRRSPIASWRTLQGRTGTTVIWKTRGWMDCTACSLFTARCQRSQNIQSFCQTGLT